MKSLVFILYTLYNFYALYIRYMIYKSTNPARGVKNTRMDSILPECTYSEDVHEALTKGWFVYRKEMNKVP